MPSPRFKLPSGFKLINRIQARESCQHELFDHVMYDKNLQGFRALLRCRCGFRKLVGTKVLSYDEAVKLSKHLLSTGYGQKQSKRISYENVPHSKRQ